MSSASLEMRERRPPTFELAERILSQVLKRGLVADLVDGEAHDERK
jgi:hypothetical protein